MQSRSWFETRGQAAEQAPERQCRRLHKSLERHTPHTQSHTAEHKHTHSHRDGAGETRGKHTPTSNTVQDGKGEREREEGGGGGERRRREGSLVLVKQHVVVRGESPRGGRGETLRRVRSSLERR